MAFGFTPKHIEDLYFDKFTPQQFLTIAIEAAKKIEWRIDFISEKGFIANTNRERFKRNSEITFKIERESASIKSESTGGEILDFGFNKRTVGKFTDAFIDFKYALKPEELDLKFEELKPSLVPWEEDVLSQPPVTTSEKVSGFFSIFIPRKGYFVTPVLIDMNILLFILMAASGVNFFLPDSDSLIKWGANFRPVTLEGEWWRLITNCFLHIGIFHLLMNMYALLYIGLLLEPRIGKANFISAYLLTGITASLASLWWHDLTISAGASGAIFGMYGVFLAMLTTNLNEKKTRKTLLTSIGIFVAYNLMYGMKGGIDNAAHIGGLIGGLVIGYALIPGLRKPGENILKFRTIGLLSILILVSSFVVYNKLPNDFGTYDAKMKEFFSMEGMALEVYHLPANTQKDKILYGIKDRGIYYWNENIKLLDSFKDLDLPLEIRTRNSILKEYCELRIKSYELIYKAISEETDKYKKQIKDCNKQIEAKLQALGDGQQAQ